MRRRPDSANGLTEYLIANAALALGARGFVRLSLNFAAWGRLLDTAQSAGLVGRAQRLIAKGLNPFFQIQSLRDFNQKFGPEWVPRSVSRCSTRASRGSSRSRFSAACSSRRFASAWMPPSGLPPPRHRTSSAAPAR